MLYMALILLWYIIGVASFIYWWTYDYDFTSEEISVTLLMGAFGPITFFMGHYNHYKGPFKIIFKKRNHG